MTRLAGIATLCALSAFGVAAQQGPSRFSATADLVVVPTVVVDKKGVPVTTLTERDFQVLEDGEPVPLQAFVPPDASGAGADGRFVVLVLDNLRTPVELAARVKTIASKFADRMGPHDVVSVITLQSGRAATTSSAAEVRAAIGRFTPAFGETIRSAAEDVATGLQAISDLSEQIAKAEHRRKVLVFIGAAWIFSPQEPSAFDDRAPALNEKWFAALRNAGRHNVSVYAIDPSGFTGAASAYGEGFAYETGGAAWMNSNDFNGAVSRIWSESGSYYLLGYAPPTSDQRRHRIEVRLTRSGLTVRARRGRG